jgi:hypothetical protein
MPRMNPLEFLNALWPDKPADQYVQIWTPSDALSRSFLKIEDAAGFVSRVHGQDVYTAFGLAPKEYGPHQRCPSREISAIAGIWSDLDLYSTAHNTKPLPRTFEDALAILPPDLPPSLVLRTGNGLQVWWLFKEMERIETQEHRDYVAGVIGRFHTLLRSRAHAKGWAYDRLADLARLLRMPGTVNSKDPAHPKEVVLQSESAFRYNLVDLEEYLDEAGIPKQEAHSKLVRDWAEQFKDKPLVVNLEARIPQDILDAWIEFDERFRKTWLMERGDLKDPSNSGYDLALANFGVDAGLTEQQIIDLIVHHRSKHGARPRRMLDYFLRTISKAWSSGKPAEELPAHLQPDPSPAPEPPTESSPSPDGKDGTAAPQPEAHAPAQPDKREQARQWLYEKLGFEILHYVVLKGKAPIGHLELGKPNPMKIELARPCIILNYGDFRNLLYDQGVTIPSFKGKKAKEWDAIAESINLLRETEDGGQELDWEGHTELITLRYLHARGFVESLDAERSDTVRFPLLVDGEIAICSDDLSEYISRRIEKTTPKTVASGLRALGAIQHRHRTRFHDQTRWFLPRSKFDVADIQRQRKKDGVN